MVLKYHSPYETITDVRGFMEKVHEIDVAVYSEEDAGEVEPMVRRYAANTETYLYVWDDEADSLAGYINFFPVNKNLKEQILDPETPYSLLDDAITPDQIVPFKKGKDHFIFILSMVVAPKYQNGAAISMLTNGFISFLRDKHNREKCRIGAIAGCAVSEEGRSVLEKLRFEKHHTVNNAGLPADPDHEKAIYICDNSKGDQKTKAGNLSKLLYLGHIKSVPDPDASIFRAESFAPGTDANGNELPGEQYIKTWTDDVYLYLPMTEHAANTATDDIFRAIPDDEADPFIRYAPLDSDQLYHFEGDSDSDENIHIRILDCLRDSIHYECSSESIKDMDVHFIGCYDFLHTHDLYESYDHNFDPIHDKYELGEGETSEDLDRRIREEIIYTDPEDEYICGLQRGYVFITSHRPTHMYVVNVFFPDYKFSTTQLEDQVSNDYIKIVDPRCGILPPYDTADKISGLKFIRLYDYLWEKYLLHKCGQEKIMLCMSNKPDSQVYKTEFENIMSAEVYNSYRQDFHVDSKGLREICRTDHSQYDYYHVYLSDMVIAFIPDNFSSLADRVEITATYSFIAELVMFQNTALARMNMKVSDLLYQNNQVTMDDVMTLEQEYGKTIPFWEPSNFKYYGTAEEAACIKKAFSNEELLNTYNKHQDYLEHMVDLMASERENRNSMILNIVATVLALIQIEGFIVEMLEGFYNRVGIEVAPGYEEFSATFTHSMLGAILLIVIYLIIRSKKKKRERRLRDGKTV